MRKALLACLAALSLAGCGTPKPSPITVPSNVRTVAVVPAVPPVIHVGATGMTVFENSLDVVDVSEWRLDDLAFETAASVLAPRYDVVRGTTDAVLVDPESKLEKAMKSATFEGVVREHVHTEKPVDLYVVISPSVVAAISTSKEPDIGKQTVYQAVGMSKFRNMFRTAPPVVHTLLLVTVMDGRTFKTLAYAPLMLPRAEAGGTRSSDGKPVERLDGFEWQDHWGELTPEQQKRVEERLRWLLATSVRNTLSTMRFDKAGEGQSALR